MSLGDRWSRSCSFLGQLAWPTISLGWMLSIYQRGKASMKRLDEIFNARGADSVAGEDLQLEISGAVEWKDVSFSYLRELTATARTATMVRYALQEYQRQSGRR